MLDVSRLRVLVAIARTGSVTAAAKELHYSQPSISHHLARLEAETGAQLVRRAGRGLRLTAAGRTLAERGAELLGRLDAAEAGLSAHADAECSAGADRGRLQLLDMCSRAGFDPRVSFTTDDIVAVQARRHQGL